jgi:hypothetical protein
MGVFGFEIKDGAFQKLDGCENVSKMDGEPSTAPYPG